MTTRAQHVAAWEGRGHLEPRGRDLFSRARPHPCERLARMEGQTNFWMVAGGSEAGADTTEDMAALAMCRSTGCIPEALEALWGGSRAHRYALAQAVWVSLHKVGAKVAAKDARRARTVILDAVDALTGNERISHKRARAIGIDIQAYCALRKAADGLLHAWAGDAAPEWIAARFR